MALALKKSSGAKTKPKAKRAKGKAAAQRLLVLVATRKGAWIFHGDTSRRAWRVDGPHFLGHTISHLVLDPRDGRTLLAAAKTGHLGPTVFRSTDMGRTWKEASRPPAFAKAPEGQKPRSVDHTFWLTPGHASEPGVWYAATSPQGLFRTADGGQTWDGIAGVNDHPEWKLWEINPQEGTPDGPKLHSVIVDPRDARHLYLGMSSGGVHESRDGGATWKRITDGLDVYEGMDARNMFVHDPHCMRMAPSNPDRLWQQNHCGTYVLDRPATTWTRVGKNMPKKVGDSGFVVVVHPRDADTAWTLPMDSQLVWPRTSPDGKPSVYVTKNAGKSWQRQDAGFPASQAWWTVKRQSMSIDACDPVGLYFGTTSGELWGSRNEGASWSCIARHLPEIYAVETAAPRR